MNLNLNYKKQKPISFNIYVMLPSCLHGFEQWLINTEGKKGNITQSSSIY